MKLYLITLTVLLSIFKVEAQTVNDWENPAVNGINKEKPHVYTFLAEEKRNNPAIQSLNGFVLEYVGKQ